jgi:hypothetical protein
MLLKRLEKGKMCKRERERERKKEGKERERGKMVIP